MAMRPRLLLPWLTCISVFFTLTAMSGAVTLTGVSVNPTTVVGGNPSTGTVTLSGAAPTGGAVVTLSSNDSHAAVPGSVTVLAGATTANFSVTTTAVTASTTPTLTAIYSGTTKTTTLTLLPLLGSLTLNQASVIGGFGATATITLNGPAPAGGAAISLTSSDTSRATVPATATVPAGATFSTFTVSTPTIASSGSATITATNAGASQTASLTTTPSAAAYSLSLSPSSVFGSASSIGTVTLNGPAPAGGAVVTLTSSNPSKATVPATVTVSANALSATFTITTVTVTSTATSTISAAYGGATPTGVLTIVTARQAFSVSLGPSTVQRGQTSTGTVTLNGPAPSGGASVTLTSSNTSNATVPSSVTVAANATTATFTVTTLAGGTLSSVTITAAYGGASPTAVLGLTGSAVAYSVTFSPGAVVGGATSTATVKLDGPAPTGGASVVLYSSNTSVATVPATVTVAVGATTGTATVTTLAVGVPTNVTIAGTYGGVTAQGTLVVNPGLPTALSVNPTSVVSGTTSTGTVTLGGAAPTGGTVVLLSSSNTLAATVPASVTVAAGTTSATFTASTLGVASSTPVTITASRLNISVTATLTVTPAALTSVGVSPTSVVGGSGSTGTVSLTGLAPPGGATVALSSSNTAAATVPASVTVTAGASTATFAASTLGVASSTNVTITATYLAVPKTATLTVTPAAITSVGVSPSSVVGGTTSTGTVTLTGFAPPAGAVVALSSSNTAAATVPANVTVPANGVTATFTVTTLGVASSTGVTITATYASVPKTTSLTVTPAANSSVSLNPTSVVGGTSATGTVTLTGSAPPGGAVVSLSSSNTGAATVPVSVTVAANASTATFTVTTLAVASSTNVTITSTYLSVQKTATLTVTPAALSAVSVNPASVVSGASSTGTVTLTGPAPTGGAVVGLTSSNTSAVTVPASVTVSAGSSTATFMANTFGVASSTPVTITATYSAVNKTATLTVTPASISSLGVSPTSVVSGATATGTVTLDGKAPPGGAVVNLSSSNTSAATVPSSVTVAANATTATYTVSTLGVSSSTPVTLSAIYSGVPKTATLTVTPVALSSVALNPTTVYSGVNSTGTVTLATAAPPGGTVVNLSSSDTSAATVPASVTVAAAATTATFTVTTLSVSSPTVVTITGITGGVTKTANLTVNPITPTSVALNPTTVAGIGTSTGTVTLVSPAPTGGTVVSLSSSNTGAATVSANVTVPAAATSATFTVATLVVGSTTNVTISALAGGVTRTATLTVSPPAVALSTLSLSPTNVASGTSSTGTVTLTAAAPSGGTAVSLSSNLTSVATVPATVTVPQGATSATFSVTTIVGGSGSATISAIYSSTTKTAVLAVYTPGPPPAELTENNSTSWATFAADSAATSVVDDTSYVKMGAKSIKFETAGAEDTGVFYPASGDAHWDLSGKNFLSFWLYAINGNSGGFQGNQPIIVLRTVGGDIQYEPAFPLMFLDSWHLYQVALSGTGYWLRTDSGSPNLGDVLQVEIHQDTWGAGFTIYYDGMQFLGGLPGELSENNAGSWAAFADDQAPISLVDDSSNVKEGAKSLKFTSQSIGETGVRYPGGDTAHWDLTAVDHIAFWDYAIDSGGGGFYSTQPVVILKSPGGFIRYDPTAYITFPNEWELYQVPLAGSDLWLATPYGSPTLSEITSVEIRQHVLSPGFIGYYDGVTFGVIPPNPTLTLGSPSTIGGTTVTGTINLDVPAPAGGTVVGLMSSNTALATAPTSVTVGSGGTTATFPVQTFEVASSQVVTISGSYGYISRAADLTVRPTRSLSAVTVASANVAGGYPTVGTVVLDGPAPSGGVDVLLSQSDDTLVAVPNDVFVSPGASSATFEIDTAVVSDPTPVTVMADFDGVQVSASFTIIVDAPPTVTVTAPTDGATFSAPASIVLTADAADEDGSVAEVDFYEGETQIGQATASPYSMTWSSVPIGTYSLTAVAIDDLGVATVSTAVSISVGGVGVSSVVIAPSGTTGGYPANCTVTLSAPAPPGGASVALSSSAPGVATVPASVAIADGATSAPFTVTTTAVTVDSAATITATYGLGSGSASLAVHPMPDLASIRMNPNLLHPELSSLGQANLTFPAPPGGSTIVLSGSVPSAVSLPANVLVPEGSSAATFSVAPVTPGVSLNISGTYRAVTKRDWLAILQPNAISAVTVNPSSVVAGERVVVGIGLFGGLSGTNVALTSSNPAALPVPASVTVPPLSSGGTLTVTAGTVATATSVTITATYNGSTKTAVVMVTPTTAVLAVTLPVSAVDLSTVAGSVRLNAPAPPGGASVSLSTASSAISSLPSTVIVPEGVQSVDFTLHTGSVPTSTDASVTATYGVSTSATITVTSSVVPLSISLATPTIVGGGQVTGTVDLNGDVPYGTAVNLSSSDPAVAAVPATALDLYGIRFTVTTYALELPEVVTISVTYNGVTKTVPLRVTHYPEVADLVLSSGTTVRSSPVLGTVTLSAPAGPLGETVALTSSNSSVATVPATVIIPAGQTVTSFQVTPNGSLSSAGTATISAALGGQDSSADLQVSPAIAIAGITLDSSVPGGSPASGTVTLNGPAGTGGASVSLQSSNPSVASVPASVTVPAGSDSAPFTLATNPVSQDTQIVVSATYQGDSASASLTVEKPDLCCLSIVGPTSVWPGQQFTVRATLTSPAPPGGLTLSVDWYSSAVTVLGLPTSVTVPEGATYVDISGTTTDGNGPCILFAYVIVSDGETTRMIGQEITDLQPVSVEFNPPIVAGGAASTATIRFNGAPPVQQTLSLVSQDPAKVHVPATVVVSGDSVQVGVTTSSVAADNAVAVTASTGLKSASGNLIVTPAGGPAIATFTLSPTTVSAGSVALGTVTLTGPARAGGAFVTFTSSNPSVATVDLVTIMPEGTSSGSFFVEATGIGSTTISASYGGVTRTAALSVTQGAGSLSSISVSPATIAGGDIATGTVTISGPAPSGGSVVGLVSSNISAASVPGTVTVPAGATSASFTVATNPVTGSTPVVITAQFGGATKTTNLTVSVPAPGHLSSLILNPVSLIGGASSTGTVVMSSAAPAGGWSVNLSSDNGAAHVPTSVSVPSGQSSATFTVTTTAGVTATATITAAYGSDTKTASLSILSGVKVFGLSPGIALPGDGNMVLFADGSDATYSVSVSGPVYALTDLSNPLCDLVAGTCPLTTLAATSGTGGTLAFTLPALATGLYLVRAQSSGGSLTASGAWLRIEQSTRTYGVLPPDQHGTAQRIYSGETVTGAFAEGGDTTGDTEDYNTYYFIGTAGSTISVSLSRVDTSKPWEDPASLDPQIRIIAPDGMLYENLRKLDDQPGVDYNASLFDAQLPLTGVYYLRAETLKGSGAYTLTFATTAVAPVPAQSRAIPFAGNFETVPVGSDVTAAAVLFDPRGYPVSGADVTFATVADSGDTGSVQFVSPATTQSTYDGSATVTVKLLTQGKVQLTTALTNPVLAQWRTNDEKRGDEAAEVRRFAPAGSLTIVPSYLDGDDAIHFEGSRVHEFPLWHPRAARQGGQSSGGPRTKASGGITPGAKPPASTNSPSALGSGDGSAPVAVPLPLGLEPKTITSCATALFVQAGVNAPAVQTPFTATVTDLTPSTGQTAQNGIVDTVSGIHGHRIEKTIRLHLDITDGTGQTPNYPVLVHLALGGPAHGKLILDPDGDRVECDQATFLWHERNAQGQIIALNEEFEYKLGTYAPYAGAVPDPNAGGALKPIWGTAEILNVTISTMDGQGVTIQLSKTFGVHPEPGKPDHIGPARQEPDPTWTFWSDWGITGSTENMPNGDPIFPVGQTITNTYALKDVYDNVEFGYTNVVQPAPVLPNLTITFSDQTAPTEDDVEPPEYSMAVNWSNNPAFPQGTFSVNFSIAYPSDPDWGGGTVTKSIPLHFDRGTFHFLMQFSNWDCQAQWPHYCVANDPIPPWTVSPSATGDAIPRTLSGWPNEVADVIDVARANFVIGTTSYGNLYQPFNYQTTFPESDDQPAFRVSVVDHYGVVAKDALFKIHLCPRYDHRPWNISSSIPEAPCTTTPVASPEGTGVIESIRVNANGHAAPDSQAYMGVELVRAPANPGDYYLKVETLEGRPYRLRQQGDRWLADSSTALSTGAWHFLTVSGLELLDDNLQRLNGTINISLDRVVYLRERNETASGDAYPIDFVLRDSDSAEEAGLQGVIMRRLGRTTLFVTDPISIISPDPPPTAVTSPPESLVAKLALRSLAGTVSPSRGRKDVLVRRGPGEAKVREAASRLVDIVAATANYDGVSPGRDSISATVKTAATGYIATRLINVNDPSIFTFDFFEGRRLTTDLSTSAAGFERGLGLESERFVTQGIPDFQAPATGGFRAIVNSQSSPQATLKPGLYRLRAKFSPYPGEATASIQLQNCGADRPDHPICYSDWILSVGARIVVAADPEAVTALTTSYLPAVGESMPTSAFMEAVASAASDVYHQAGANVAVTTDPEALSPRLIQRLRASISSAEYKCSRTAVPVVYYGCSADAAFPWTGDSIDLAPEQGYGISLEAAYNGKSKDDGQGNPAIVNHLPLQPRNSAPDSWGDLNPSPATIFRNRVINLFVHESGHGFGLASSKHYSVHGSPLRDATLSAVAVDYTTGYTELPAVGDQAHESIWLFGQNDPRSNVWAMQAGPFRWNGKEPLVPDHYDFPPPGFTPNHWLVFDRPMRFSLFEDWEGETKEDQSIEQFFRERIPLCVDATPSRECR